MAGAEYTKEQRYRHRARELRAIAADIKDEQAQKVLLQAADEYELLADGARRLPPANPLSS
jgi:hypothetical protein